MKLDDMPKKESMSPLRALIFGNLVPQRLFRIYFSIVLIGALLLMLPFSIRSSGSLSFLDALFTSASAFSDTGLTVKTTSEFFTFFGQLVILILIQFGGIGLMTLKVMIALLFGVKLSIVDKTTLSAERGLNRLGGSMKFVISIIKIVFVFQFVLAILFGLRYYFGYFHNPDYPFQGNVGTLIWHSIFHAVSAVNNAGFDITGAHSFLPYAQDYFIQSLVMLGLIFGGIGFPVFYDLKLYFQSRKNDVPFRFSLFTKITVKMYFIVAIVGILLVFGAELMTPTGILFNEAYTLPQRVFYVVFHTISTRNAGFSTIDINQFSHASRIIFAIWMWIGASPASTAGGIRTTTLYLAFLAILRIVRHEQHVNVYNKRIPIYTVVRALVIAFVSQLLIFFSVMVIMISMEPNANFLMTFFEACSAFGTTGLSLGLTTQLNAVGKIVLVLLMFIGQQGITSTLLLWNNRNLKPRPVLVEEDVLIG